MEKNEYLLFHWSPGRSGQHPGVLHQLPRIADRVPGVGDEELAVVHHVSHILNNAEDSEECVNDTWLHAWNAMPPQRPNVLRMFLAKLQYSSMIWLSSMEYHLCVLSVF